MLEFLAANLATILVGLLVLAVFAAIVVHAIRSHTRGKGSCSCGCSGCPSSGVCHGSGAGK